MRVSILKLTPIIYPAFEKNILFIYLISQKVDLFIYCSLSYIPFHIICNCVWGGKLGGIFGTGVGVSILGHLNSQNQAIHILSFFIKGGLSYTLGCHIPWGAGKRGLFGTHIHTQSYIGYPPPML